VQVDRKVLIWIGVLAGIVVVAVGGYLLLRPEDDPRGTSDRVNDTASGLRWDMYDEPVEREVEVDLDGEGPNPPVTAREFTVDHATGWVERIVVFDAGAGAVDYERAALSVFGDADGELEDGEFVKIAADYDAVSGAADGTKRGGDEELGLEARVFAGQISGYVVAGGVAVVEGEDPPIELQAQADELLASVRTPG
jgi:hypothetical protein